MRLLDLGLSVGQQLRDPPYPAYLLSMSVMGRRLGEVYADVLPREARVLAALTADTAKVAYLSGEADVDGAWQLYRRWDELIEDPRTHGPLGMFSAMYTLDMLACDSARREVPFPPLARWLLGLGIAATLAANVAHGLGHGPVGAAVAAWSAIALVGSYELFMTIIRGARQPDGGVSGGEHVPGAVSGPDLLRVQAAEVFAAEVAAGRVPSIRAIRSRLRVGQPRVRAYLDALADG